MNAFPSFLLGNETPRDFEWINHGSKTKFRSKPKQPQTVRTPLDPSYFLYTQEFAYLSPRGDWRWGTSEGFVVERGGRKYILVWPFDQDGREIVRVRYTRTREFLVSR